MIETKINSKNLFIHNEYKNKNEVSEDLKKNYLKPNFSLKKKGEGTFKNKLESEKIENPLFRNEIKKAEVETEIIEEVRYEKNQMPRNIELPPESVVALKQEVSKKIEKNLNIPQKNNEVINNNEKLYEFEDGIDFDDEIKKSGENDLDKYSDNDWTNNLQASNNNVDLLKKSDDFQYSQEEFKDDKNFFNQDKKIKGNILKENEENIKKLILLKNDKVKNNDPLPNYENKLSSKPHVIEENIGIHIENSKKEGQSQEASIEEEIDI